MNQLIIATGMLASATPYFLPRDQIPAAAPAGETMPGLPAENSFLVWHDSLLVIDEGVHALAWVFSTDSNGELEEVAHMVRAHDNNALDVSWVSLRAGSAADSARAVALTLVTHAWDKAKKLRLPGKAESSAWTKDLVRFRGRARRGGLHGLHTLAGSE